jgi:hypothetical protein
MMTQDIIDTFGERVIRGDELLVMLRRVETGEQPNHVFAEMWASLARVPVDLEILEGEE